MPSYIKASLTVAQAQEIVERRFNERSASSLTTDEEEPRFFKIVMVFLYASVPSGKKLNVVKGQKGEFRKNRLLEVEKYHRFVMLGNRDTEEVFALFTSTANDSHNLLRYFSSIRPGVPIHILNPQLEGFLKLTNTCLLSTVEPLVPLAEPPVIRNLALPHSVDVATFKYFEFTSTSVYMSSATPTECICPGFFCDAQTVLDPCGCIAVTSRKTWAITFQIRCDELRPMDDVSFVELTSTNLTDLYVANSKRQLSPTATEFDPFDLDDAVLNLTRSINNTGGWKVKGWYKPSTSEDGVAQELRRIHFCSLSPVGMLTDAQNDMKYQ